MNKANITDFNSSVPKGSTTNVAWTNNILDTRIFMVNKEWMQTKESLNKMQFTSVVSLEET